MIKKHALNALRNFPISFTILIIGHLIFSYLGIWSDLCKERALQLLIICLIVNFLQFIITFLPINSIYVDVPVRLVGMYLVVFFLGGKVFHMFRYSMKNMISIGGLLLVIAVAIYVRTFYLNIKEIRRINEIIKKEREEHV